MHQGQWDCAGEYRVLIQSVMALIQTKMQRDLLVYR